MIEAAALALFVVMQTLDMVDNPIALIVSWYHVIPFGFAFIVLASGVVPGSIHGGFGKWSNLVYGLVLVFSFVVQVALTSPVVFFLRKWRTRR
jgi:hypothetical protein